MANKRLNPSGNFDRLFGTSQSSRNLSGLMMIRLDQIETAPQPRTVFDQERLTELAQSIQDQKLNGGGVEGTGILQPLLVAAIDNGRFRLVAGERRFRASKSIGLLEVPCIVVAKVGATLAAQLIENVQRQDLMPIEEARALDAYLSEKQLSVREAAAQLGKDRGWVQNRVKLMKCSPDVLAMVEQRADSLPHAFEIDAVTDLDLRKSLIAATIEGASVAEVRRRIAAHSNQADDESGPTPAGSEVSFQNDNGANDSKGKGDSAQPGATAKGGNVSGSEKYEVMFQPTFQAMDETTEKIRNAFLNKAERKTIEKQLEALREKIKEVESIIAW